MAIDKPFDVKGKVAFVTGANRGIGKSIVEALLKQGVKKVYTGVRDVKSVAALTKSYGDKIVPIHLDLDKPETIEQAAERCNDVTLVVNNAGVFRSGSAMDEDAIETMQYELNINVFGLMRMAQAFAPVITKNGGGVFVQLNSVASLKCFADFATYSASKAAAYSITQGLREMLAKQNIRVISVHPGPIDTNMAADAGLSQIAEPPDVVAQGLIKALSTGQFHLFPDRLANEVGTAYQSFAKNVVEAENHLE